MKNTQGLSASLTWQQSSFSSSSTGDSGVAGFSPSFSMGLNNTFFISLSLMSGLAALISIFRLAVGVSGSTVTLCFTGVTCTVSEAGPFLVNAVSGEVESGDFSTMDFLLSVKMFS